LRSPDFGDLDFPCAGAARGDFGFFDLNFAGFGGGRRISAAIWAVNFSRKPASVAVDRLRRSAFTSGGSVVGCFMAHQK
jgi:hypothetical protein